MNKKKNWMTVYMITFVREEVLCLKSCQMTTCHRMVDYYSIDLVLVRSSTARELNIRCI